MCESLESTKAMTPVRGEFSFEDKEVIQIMRQLPDFEPSPTLLEAMNFNFSNKSLAVDNNTFSSYLQTKELTSENVCSVLSTLLSIEDVSTMHLYTHLMEPNVLLKRVGTLKFKFMLTSTKVNPEDVIVPNMDQAVLIPKASLLEDPLSKYLILALLPHKHEKLPLRDPMRRFIANVTKVTRKSIVLKFKPGAFHGDLTTSRYLVVLRSRRTSFRCKYRALQLLQEISWLRSYLFPIQQLQAISYNDPSLDIKLFNTTIESNKEQFQAVNQIVNGPNMHAPFIVFGPPGTGKTTVVVEAILQLRLRKPRSRILVTAGSNSACDTIAVKLCEYFTSNKRLQSILNERATDPLLMDVKRNHQLIRVFSRSVYMSGTSTIDPLLLKYSNCAKHTFKVFHAKKLRRFGIIVATLCTVGRLVTENIGASNFFTHVFIDEAGASTEPETLIGIVGIKQQANCNVILSGDHKQLGPVITNNRAAVLGLGVSLMERLLRSEIYAVDSNGNYNHTVQTRLRFNYRSHPEIVGLYNKLYYNDELIPKAPLDQVNMAANWSLLPNKSFPIIFQAAHGTTERNDHSMSSLNLLEVQVLYWYVKRLLEKGLDGGIKVKEMDIGVVVPYAAQSRLIQKKLSRQGYNIEVGSVEKFQGREKPIIIASLVRSFSNIGFIRNPRRVNVLISRAKSLLILIGNPVTFRHHSDINYIINQCKIHDNYLFKSKNTILPTILSNMFKEEIIDNDEEQIHPDGNFCYGNLVRIWPTSVQLTNRSVENSSEIDGLVSLNGSSSSSSSSLDLEMSKLMIVPRGRI